MNKISFIKARVCVRIDNEVICTLGQKKIVLSDDENKGRLLDGREVVKLDNWWYYIPPGQPIAIIEGKTITKTPKYEHKEETKEENETAVD
jgi:hypothetical protein